MVLEQQWTTLVSGQARGPGAVLARGALTVASALYATGLAANLWVYNLGLKRRTVPAIPVVSIGNISLGGTGKTTAAAFVARRVLDRVKPAIILRGYQRQMDQGSLIVSDGQALRAELAQAGDEALMLARMLPGCAVAVGKRRERVIQAVHDETRAQVAILDDGFQYFRMARHLDIVLLDALADENSWRLFPAGRLREPASHLVRADQVWITHADLAPHRRVRELCALAHRYCPHGHLAITCHRLAALRPLSTQELVPDSLSGQPVLALSALGNPQAFELGLAAQGATVHPLRFPDHHAYTALDWQRIIQAAAAARVEAIVTTEKDAVKLPHPPPHCPPVLVAGCELRIIEGAEGIAHALTRLCDEVAR